MANGGNKLPEFLTLSYMFEPSKVDFLKTVPFNEIVDQVLSNPHSEELESQVLLYLSILFSDKETNASRLSALSYLLDFLPDKRIVLIEFIAVNNSVQISFGENRTQIFLCHREAHAVQLGCNMDHELATSADSDVLERLGIDIVRKSIKIVDGAQVTEYSPEELTSAANKVETIKNICCSSDQQHRVALLCTQELISQIGRIITDFTPIGKEGDGSKSEKMTITRTSN